MGFPEDEEQVKVRITKPFQMGRTVVTQGQWRAVRGTEPWYSFGDDAAQLAQYGWFKDNSGGQTHPVGQKQPNAWVLFDMHGNVEEWCSDWYDYTFAGGDDPVGPSLGSGRVLRGGSWLDAASLCRSAWRHRVGPSFGDCLQGFRLALSPSGVKPPERGK